MSDPVFEFFTENYITAKAPGNLPPEIGPGPGQFMVAKANFTTLVGYALTFDGGVTWEDHTHDQSSVNPDWAEQSPSSPAFILNKPDLSAAGQMFNVDSLQFEAVAPGGEYLSPDQHGGIFGEVLRVYIDTRFDNFSVGDNGRIVNTFVYTQSARISYANRGAHFIIDRRLRDDTSTPNVNEATNLNIVQVYEDSGYEFIYGWVDFVRVD